MLTTSTFVTVYDHHVLKSDCAPVGFIGIGIIKYSAKYN